MFGIDFIYKCNECGKELILAYECNIDSIPKPPIPAGWTLINDGFICDEHKITVIDNLKVVK